ncbi:MAG: hypothetical protein F4176_08565, partial [Acidimicrobiia bacterium]|nr:hypothetical protein [Acidimicrobiia bacterium]
MCHSLARSHRVERILVAPGNAGTAGEERCENVAVGAGDVAGLVALAERESVDLVALAILTRDAVYGVRDPWG